MEGNYMTNNCSFSGLKPIMVDLPYPPVRVQGENRDYAELLSVDYCGSVSEMTAIAQYINNENRLSCEKCPMARTLLGMALSEMTHLQKLGELIFLLGGTIDFAARGCSGKSSLWTPEYLTIPSDARKMVIADMEAERATINQYEMHINMIDDEYVNAMLSRIITDEEYHIMLLKALLEEL